MELGVRCWTRTTRVTGGAHALQTHRAARQGSPIAFCTQRRRTKTAPIPHSHVLSARSETALCKSVRTQGFPIALCTRQRHTKIALCKSVRTYACVHHAAQMLLLPCLQVHVRPHPDAKWHFCLPCLTLAAYVLSIHMPVRLCTGTLAAGRT